MASVIELLVRRRERLGGSGLPVSPLGAICAEVVVGPGEPEIGMAGAHGRRAGDDAVELGGIALRGHHAFAAAGRAADEVGTAALLAVIAAR